MLKRKKILITSGPTRYPLDAVRFISNISTGHFGTLLAKEALKKGFWVTFVYGMGSEVPKKHRRLRLLEVETNEDLKQVLKNQLSRASYSIAIHAMAVLDFKPQKNQRSKTKTKRGDWVVPFVPTPKVIRFIKKWDPKVMLVGFKLEVGVSEKILIHRAKLLTHESNADFVLANQLAEGRDSDHVGYFLNQKGELLFKAKGKEVIAKSIFRYLASKEKRAQFSGPFLFKKFCLF